jgi:hypothetical protein
LLSGNTPAAQLHDLVYIVIVRVQIKGHCFSPS